MIKQKFKVIELAKKKTFTQSLESRARQLVAKNGKANKDILSSGLEQQITLTISHIQGVRILHGNIQRSLQYEESNIDLELMRMNRKKYPACGMSYQYRRDQLKEQLREIAKERRRLAVQKVSAMQPLQDRLLNMLERHAVLNPRA